MLLIDNLSARITVILLAGGMVMALMIAVLAGAPADEGGPRVFQIPMPRETLAMVEAVEAGAPPARPAITHGLDATVMGASLVPALPPLGPGVRAATPADPGYGGYRRALGDRAFSLELRRGGRLRTFAPGRDALRLSVALKGGGVLVLQRRGSGGVRNLVARAAALLACGAMAVLALMVLAVRATTRPVAALARAAERFGDRLDDGDLPLRGPGEIRALAAAFNAMKQRIRGLVDDRTRVLAAVAHDMRTYLTRLRLRAEFISHAGQRAKAIADLDEMAALLDDTLLFAQEEAGQGGPAKRLDLKRELSGLVGVRREMGEEVTLEVADDILVHASPLALRRMVANLIDNALRFGGAAEVVADCARGEVCIAVRDRGPGLPVEALDRVTGPFERVEQSRNRDTGGAGLGLAIVRALSEAQGGRLTLSNRPEGGLSAEDPPAGLDPLV